jgi:AAA15 family ATPase/GTPase
MKIIIQNIRSLTGQNLVPITPLTILTGENSSGKSTFLAVLSWIFKESFPFFSDFNQEPFELGTYETIATNMGGKFKQSSYFGFGYIADDNRRVLVKYQDKDGTPEIAEVSVTNSDQEIGVAFPKTKRERASFRVRLKNNVSFQFLVPGKVQDHFRSYEPVLYGSTVQMFMRYFRYINMGKDLKRELKIQDEIAHLIRSIPPSHSRALAPIRTRPRRTYDKPVERVDSEGEYIPDRLSRFFDTKDSTNTRRDLKKILRSFGQESGLFKGIEVKRLRRKVAYPFELNARIFNKPTNILDVGYGVSQALPILVETALLEKNRMLLLQQPEVHLHPKAQAALGTFFAQTVARGGKQFVVETHSDYIIDRIRQEISKGTINKDLVSILFFHKEPNGTRVYPITFDEMGNIKDAPSFYRDFFLKEDQNLFNR